MNLGLGLFLNARGGGAFTPAALANVAHWYRADQGITLNAGKVSQWNDLVGSAHLVQATGANQPAYNAMDASYSNMPTVQSTAIGQFLVNTTVPLAQAFTVWVVGEFGSAGNVCAIGVANAGAAYFGVNAGVAYGYAGITLSSGVSGAAKHASLSTFNGASSFIGVNNWLTGGVSGAAGAQAMNALSAFAFPSGVSGTVGKIAEIIIQAGAPTAAEKTNMAAYFARYGITVT